MSSSKPNKFANKLLEHLDKLDNASLQAYLLRLINDKGFFENVFNTIREGIIVIDKNLNIQFVNSAAGPLLGIHLEDSGQNISRFLRQVPWKEIIASNIKLPSASRREVEIFYPEHRFLSFYLMPFANGVTPLTEDAPIATLIFQDVTENVQTAENNAETQKIKAITQLAAGVAHELGNPLNSLGIHLQLLRRTLTRNTESEENNKMLDLVETAQGEIKRLDSIVKNFLNAVRPAPLTPIPVDIPNLLNSAVSFMRNEIQDRGIQLEMQLPHSIPTIYGDGDQLIQAFFNIIKNSLQAMPDGGTLYIACTVDDIYVNIKFIDTGKGITDEEMRQLMDPYFTTKSSGSGLGLLIIDRIIRAHGGTFTIEGEPNKGAAVTISLPLHVRQTRMIESY